MRILLDTHIILWALNGSVELSESARELIADGNNEVYYSVASLWEVTIKHLSHPDKMLISGSQLSEMCKALGFVQLPIREEHIKVLETLKREINAKPHNAPFDRILISQAKEEKLKLMTHDNLIVGYNEDCILLV